MRFEVALALLFWTFSIGITVLQQSSVLSDVEKLWLTRFGRAHQVEKQLSRFSQLVHDHKISASVVVDKHDGGGDDRGEGSPRRGDNSTSLLHLMKIINDLSARHSALDAKSREIVRSFSGADPDATAASDDEFDGRQQQKQNQKNGGKNQKKRRVPLLRPMRTSCGDWSTSEALKHLVSDIRDKLFEPDASGLLNAMNAGRGGGGGLGTALDGVRMDRGLSQLDAELEAALTHIEENVPQLVEKWVRWFGESGDAVPAPKFDVDSKPHVSEKMGRKLFKEALRNGNI